MQLRGPVTPAELVAYCAERLGRHKHPREVHVVDAVPITSVGKTDLKALRRTLTPPPPVA